MFKGVFTAAKAGTAYFGLVFVIAFMFGIIRTVLLVPRLGEVAAVVVEAPLVLAVSWWVCGLVIRRLAVPARWQLRLVMGGLAFALLMIAELAVSMLLFGRSAAAHWSGFAAPAAQLGLAAQLLFALFPLWAGHRG